MKLSVKAFEESSSRTFRWTRCQMKFREGSGLYGRESRDPNNHAKWPRNSRHSLEEGEANMRKLVSLVVLVLVLLTFGVSLAGQTSAQEALEVTYCVGMGKFGHGIFLGKEHGVWADAHSAMVDLDLVSLKNKVPFGIWYDYRTMVLSVFSVPAGTSAGTFAASVIRVCEEDHWIVVSAKQQEPVSVATMGVSGVPTLPNGPVLEIPSIK